MSTARTLFGLQLVQSSAVGPLQVVQLPSHGVQLELPLLPKKPSAQTQAPAVQT